LMKLHALYGKKNMTATRCNGPSKTLKWRLVKVTLMQLASRESSLTILTIQMEVSAAESNMKVAFLRSQSCMEFGSQASSTKIFLLQQVSLLLLMTQVTGEQLTLALL